MHIYVLKNNNKEKTKWPATCCPPLSPSKPNSVLPALRGAEGCFGEVCVCGGGGVGRLGPLCPLGVSRRREERAGRAARGCSQPCVSTTRGRRSGSAARGRREAAAGTEQQMLFSPSSFKPPMLGNYWSRAAAAERLARALCACARARAKCVCVGGVCVCV